jgi:hypothetical protein
LHAISQPLAPQSGEPLATGGQVVPHALQFMTSVASATHSPLQAEKPLAQSNAQTLAPHLAAPLLGAAQEIAQSLQCFGSFERSAQVPAQLAWPLGQSLAHAPPLHTWPGPQALPQLPQLPVLVCRSMQAPPQLANPPLHVMPHTPPTQTAMPFAGASHTVSQAPQWSMSVILFTQLEPQAA